MKPQTKICETIYKTITSKEILNIDETEKLLDFEGIQNANQFTQLLNELKDDKVIYTIHGNNIQEKSKFCFLNLVS